jgi:hypothetical protein
MSWAAARRAFCEIKNAATCPAHRPVPSLDRKVKPEIGDFRRKGKFKEAHPTLLETVSGRTFRNAA